MGRYGVLDAWTIWAESGAGEVAPERRVAQDGNAYTWEEFVDCYGWVDAATIWADCGTAQSAAALPQAVPPLCPMPSRAEQFQNHNSLHQQIMLLAVLLSLLRSLLRED